MNDLNAISHIWAVSQQRFSISPASCSSFPLMQSDHIIERLTHGSMITFTFLTLRWCEMIRGKSAITWHFHVLTYSQFSCSCSSIHPLPSFIMIMFHISSQSSRCLALNFRTPRIGWQKFSPTWGQGWSLHILALWRNRETMEVLAARWCFRNTAIVSRTLEYQSFFSWEKLTCFLSCWTRNNNTTICCHEQHDLTTNRVDKSGGYYKVKVRPGFRVICLNTNYCTRLNPWSLFDPVDPGVCGGRNHYRDYSGSSLLTNFVSFFPSLAWFICWRRSCCRRRLIMLSLCSLRLLCPVNQFLSWLSSPAPVLTIYFLSPTAHYPETTGVVDEGTACSRTGLRQGSYHRSHPSRQQGMYAGMALQLSENHRQIPGYGPRILFRSHAPRWIPSTALPVPEADAHFCRVHRAIHYILHGEQSRLPCLLHGPTGIHEGSWNLFLRSDGREQSWLF